MKFSCTKENFHRGLFFTAHIAGKTNTLPILGNVQLNAAAGALTIISTNLEIGIRATVRGKVEDDGSFTVDAKLLTDYVSLLPNTRVDVELIKATEPLTGSALNITAGEYSTTIHGSSAEEFPLLPAVERITTIELSVKELRNAIAQTLFAAAQEDSRPELHGAYLRIEPNGITLAATDSFRLAERKVPLKTPLDSTPANPSAILPARTLAELARILSVIEEDAVITLILSPTQFLASLEGVELISRLVDRKYPDYVQVIPTASTLTGRFPKTELVSAVRAASLFCRSGVNDVKLSLDDGTMTIAASGARGQHTSKVHGEIEGSGSAVVLNSRYLLDGLNALPAVNVKIELTSPSQPCVLRAADGPDAASYLYLIMPIKQ